MARPAWELVASEIEDQHRDRHDNEEAELGEGRDAADDAGGRE